MYQLNTPSFNVYTQMLVEKRKPKKGDIVITKITNLQKLKGEVLYKKGSVVLLKITD